MFYEDIVKGQSNPAPASGPASPWSREQLATAAQTATQPAVTTPTTTTQTTTPTTTQPITPTPTYSRLNAATSAVPTTGTVMGSSGNVDTNATLGNLTGQAANVTPPKSEADIYTDLVSKNQSYIDAVNASFAAQLNQQSYANQAASKAAEYNAAAGGMMGTPAGRDSLTDVSNKNAAANQVITTNQRAAVAKILSDLDTQAQNIYQFNKGQYSTDLQNAIKNVQDIQTASQTSFKDLAATSSLGWDEFKTAYPDQAQKFLDTTGYSSSEAMFKWNAAKSAAQQIQWNTTPQKTATGYLFYGTDPKTGKIVTNSVDVPLSSEWTISPGNMYQDTMLYNKTTGEYKTLKSYTDAIPGNISSLTPTGSQGGECGEYVHTVVDGIPQMGDTIQSKEAAIDKSGVKAANWTPKIGDVIVQTLGDAGHAAVVNAVNPDGTVTLSESNYNLDGLVNNTRTISAKDPSIYGAFTNGQIKSGVADGSMSPRQLAMEQKLAQLKRTEKLTETADVMMASRRSTITNNVIKSLYGSAVKNPVAIYNNSAQVINRINPALKSSLDSGTVAKNVPDLDLIDAYVQIARGGQAITEAQVETLLQGLGVQAKFDVATQKITGSATLDDATRKQLAQTSKNIYDEQGKTAAAAVKQINSQLKNNSIPDNMLFKAPIDIAGSEAAATTSIDDATLQSLQSQLSADEVLGTDSAGNIVAATQAEIDDGTYTALNP